MELFDSIKQLNESRTKSGRRKFMFGAVGLVASYYGFRWWRDRPRPAPQIKTRYITPTAEFYSIAIDSGFVTNVKRDDWRLEVIGLDGQKLALSYDDLLKLERKRIFKTFMCVGNEVGGPAIGNAEWTVTALGPIVKRALGETHPAGLRVVFRALDGFYSSAPLAVALSDQSFIAYEMNGAALNNKHGFPARVLLPNIYGMKQPRWLKSIEINSGNESGYWEKRGWCNECSVKMTARIDSAISQTEGDWLITGIAYCGGQTVGKVECSFDRGQTWREVKITSEREPNAWATWETGWRPEKKGEQIITARVTDAAGNKQIETYDGNFPSGSSGLHRVTVTV